MLTIILIIFAGLAAISYLKETKTKKNEEQTTTKEYATLCKALMLICLVLAGSSAIYRTILNERTNAWYTQEQRLYEHMTPTVYPQDGATDVCAWVYKSDNPEDITMVEYTFNGEVNIIEAQNEPIIETVYGFFRPETDLQRLVMWPRMQTSPKLIMINIFQNTQDE